MGGAIWPREGKRVGIGGCLASGPFRLIQEAKKKKKKEKPIENDEKWSST